MGGKQNLLLGSLDDRGGVDVVSFFELLAGDVGELGLGNEGLRFGADELLLESYELGGFGLFVLELLDLILDLKVAVSAIVAATGAHTLACLTFCLCVRLGCTELSVLRICFKTVLLSSKP